MSETGCCRPSSSKSSRKRNPRVSTKLGAIQFYAIQFLLEAVSYREKMTDATWVVIDTSRSLYELLTSDRPIFKSDSLGIGGNLTMPIGPRQLLVMMHAVTSLPKLSGAKLDRLVCESNSRVVEAAQRFA